jgi:hypothetical protein
MNAFKLLRKVLLYTIPLGLCLTGPGSLRNPLAAQGNNAAQAGNQDEEVQMGQQVFDDPTSGVAAGSCDEKHVRSLSLVLVGFAVVSMNIRAPGTPRTGAPTSNREFASLTRAFAPQIE